MKAWAVANLKIGTTLKALIQDTSFPGFDGDENLR
jgi:hypothetical protein